MSGAIGLSSAALGSRSRVFQVGLLPDLYGGAGHTKQVFHHRAIAPAPSKQPSEMQGIVTLLLLKPGRESAGTKGEVLSFTGVATGMPHILSGKQFHV